MKHSWLVSAQSLAGAQSFGPHYLPVPSTRRKAASPQLPECVSFLPFSSILTAIDRGAGLAGVPPGLPQGAAAGGAADAHPNLGIAGQTSISPRTKLQVAVAHAVVCRATQELEITLIIVRLNVFSKEGPSNDKIQILYIHPQHKIISCFKPFQDSVVGIK